MNNYKINDVVWVRTGLAGTHEEPATILQLDAAPKVQEEENRDQSEFVLVMYNVSRYNEIVPLTRIRKLDNFKSEQEGPRRSSRRSRKPESVSFRCGDDSENKGGIIDEVVKMERTGIDSSIITEDPHMNSESKNLNFCLPCEEEKKDDDKCTITMVRQMAIYIFIIFNIKSSITLNKCYMSTIIECIRKKNHQKITIHQSTRKMKSYHLQPKLI